jgi:hypothetical protein
MSEKYMIVKGRNLAEFSERIKQLKDSGFKIVYTESYARSRLTKKNLITDSYFPYAAKMIPANER